MQAGDDEDDNGQEEPTKWVQSHPSDKNAGGEEVYDTHSAIMRIVSYAASTDKYHRCMVGRNALHSIRNAASNPADVADILDVVSSLVDDPEATVRGEIMEYVPLMALLLSEEPAVPALQDLIGTHLLPAIVKVLNDPDQQVLKMAENALITMLEHCLVGGEFIESQVWPVIERRMQSSPVKSTIVVLILMSKMAPWVGSDLTIRLFVPVLVKFSKSNECVIRRVCASIFGEICTVVGADETENSLLQAFIDLCHDEAWGVRKTCADSFMLVSCTVSLETRKDILAPTFASLLADTKSWIQLTFFESLGPFITTFAQPSVTTLAYNKKDELVLQHPNGYEFKLHRSKVECIGEIMEEENIDFFEAKGYFFSDESISGSKLSSPASNFIFKPHTSDKTWGEENMIKGEMQEDVENYNQFNFWRDPVVAIDLEDWVKDSSPITEGVEKDSPLVESYAKFVKKWQMWKDSQIVKEKSEAENSNSSTFAQDKMKCPNSSRSFRKQEIVPDDLVRHFVSMSTPRQGRMSTNELAHYCAYNLPAVALTLGPENWGLLKDAYENLAANSQWRVRRIVASSIHDLALIVGEDLATQDLLPIFMGFIKDLDDVRIGALKHLANFLKILKPAGRNSFLPSFAEFLMTDCDSNWRFREELGIQLVQALGLFTPSDTCHFLSPVAISILKDKVAQVRRVALQLVTELVNHVSIDVNLLRGLLAELAGQFAHSNQWNRRQTFAFFCSSLLSERVLSEEMFARDVLPHLLDLSWDRVPNVRIAVAQVLSTHAMAISYFADPMSPHHEVLVAVLKRLQGDKDRDVRYFATLPPKDSTDEQVEIVADQEDHFASYVRIHKMHKVKCTEMN